MPKVFDYSCYKIYLNEKILSMPKKGRGIKKDLAQFLGCQTTYVSQVLNGYANFNLEQAQMINNFFQHTSDEKRYFIFLVEAERAGTSELKKFFQEEMQKIREKRAQIKHRVKIKKTLNEKDQHIYYSAWYYAAIHMMLTIERYKDPSLIEQALNLPRSVVVEALDFLVKTGLAKEIEGKYEAGVARIHLAPDSIQIRKHHANLRNQSLINIDKNIKEDLHYSSILSIAEGDIPVVKELILRAIEDFRKVIVPSNPESVQILNIDFFNLV